MKIKKQFVLAIVGLLAAAALGGQVEAAEPSDDIEKTETSKAAIEFNPGPLTLDIVPQFQFGEKDIQPDNQSYSPITSDSVLQVTDLRGTGAGWRVTATMSDFLNEDGEPVFKGAKLDFNGGTLHSESQNKKPTIESVELEVGETKNVMAANSGAGLGSWVTEWSSADNTSGNKGVELIVPAGSAMKGNHTAEIIWTLEDTP